MMGINANGSWKNIRKLISCINEKKFASGTTYCKIVVMMQDRIVMPNIEPFIFMPDHCMSQKPSITNCPVIVSINDANDPHKSNPNPHVNLFINMIIICNLLIIIIYHFYIDFGPMQSKTIPAKKQPGLTVSLLIGNLSE